ncbi:MAG TPA: ATPase domain-containing protein [Gemmatimonadaceae bacterium]|jgi:circadian clock protein KaiC|nr:ATPase domain-containing protein [Gemmatimonadaceae bacterium]
MTTELLPESAPGDDLFPRIKTGNPQADEILGGGFPCNSINIVMGQPGTGKTIFAEQLLFHNSTGDRPLLYVTTLSEPMSKVVSYVQRFDFFDANRLGNEIQYDDLGSTLSERGPAALTEWLADAIKTRSPKVIVIDSFRAIHDLTMSVDESRRFISAIAGLLAAYDVTTFLLGEYTQDDIQRFPEFAVADAIVELARQPRSTRDERFLRVIKLRGSAYREGHHAFRITNTGLDLYPRLVAPRVPEAYESLAERLPTGAQGLDKMVGGGLLAGTTTLIVGMTGSGKTTLALQFALEGVRRGEQTLYVNFQENPAQLRRAITNLGADPDSVRDQGFRLLYASPVELQIDSIVVEIFEAIKSGAIKRLVIDAVGDLAAAASDSQRLHDYLYSLIQHFAARGVTTILTLESGEGFTGGVIMNDQRFSYMSDNLIYLAWSAEKVGHRTIRVVKMRGSGHERDTREFEIGEHGARIK